MVTVDFATSSDLAFCLEYDHCKDPQRLMTRIAAQEVIIAKSADTTVGYLTIQYIWGVLPYINLIRVAKPLRRQGIGKAMLRFLETYLKEQGHVQLLSSSQADEPQPQAWHRARGFAECGLLAGINEHGVGELFFRKELV